MCTIKWHVARCLSVSGTISRPSQSTEEPGRSTYSADHADNVEDTESCKPRKAILQWRWQKKGSTCATSCAFKASQGKWILSVYPPLCVCVCVCMHVRVCAYVIVGTKTQKQSTGLWQMRCLLKPQVKISFPCKFQFSARIGWFTVFLFSLTVKIVT